MDLVLALLVRINHDNICDRDEIVIALLFSDN